MKPQQLFPNDTITFKAFNGQKSKSNFHSTKIPPKHQITTDQLNRVKSTEKSVSLKWLAQRASRARRPTKTIRPLQPFAQREMRQNEQRTGHHHGKAKRHKKHRSKNVDVQLTLIDKPKSRTRS